MPDENQAPLKPDDYAELPNNPQEATRVLHQRALRKLGTVFWLGFVAHAASCTGCHATDEEMSLYDPLHIIGTSLGFWLLLYTLGYAILWAIFMVQQSAGKL